MLHGLLVFSLAKLVTLFQLGFIYTFVALDLGLMYVCVFLVSGVQHNDSIFVCIVK